MIEDVSGDIKFDGMIRVAICNLPTRLHFLWQCPLVLSFRTLQFTKILPDTSLGNNTLRVSTS